MLRELEQHAKRQERGVGEAAESQRAAARVARRPVAAWITAVSNGLAMNSRASPIYSCRLVVEKFCNRKDKRCSLAAR